jgi:anaerobic selenocysteine-containing dehydrogenase
MEWAGARLRCARAGDPQARRRVHEIGAGDHRLVSGHHSAQHEHSIDTIREIVNLLLLRGNIGREGAGPCPIRGHSNVQGNRTCGITHRPQAAFLDRLAEVCKIDPPREHGLGAVQTIEAMRRGDVKMFVSLGGNFALATPDPAYTFEALENCELTVQVSTKLNRSHIVHASGR